MPNITATERGKSGERIAEDFLRKKGFRILERNYRYLRAEVDLICRKGNELVFVEVKYRSGESFGPGEESVTAAKQAQLRKAAEGYLQEKNIDASPCRFDVVAISDSGGLTTITHFEQAFF